MHGVAWRTNHLHRSTMRASCSGCRALHKGCGDACIMRPCLDWIRSPDAQANATRSGENFCIRVEFLLLCLLLSLGQVRREEHQPEDEADAGPSVPG